MQRICYIWGDEWLLLRVCCRKMSMFWRDGAVWHPEQGNCLCSGDTCRVRYTERDPYSTRRLGTMWTRIHSWRGHYVWHHNNDLWRAVLPANGEKQWVWHVRGRSRMAIILQIFFISDPLHNRCICCKNLSGMIKSCSWCPQWYSIWSVIKLNLILRNSETQWYIIWNQQSYLYAIANKIRILFFYICYTGSVKNKMFFFINYY